MYIYSHKLMIMVFLAISGSLAPNTANAACTPNADEVAVYQHSNYRGICSVLRVGDCNSTAASLLTHCFLASDARDIPAIANGCCSFELGYCIECPDSASEKCEMVEIRVTPPKTSLEEAGGASVVAPPVAEGRDHRATPEAGAVAPSQTRRDHRTAPAGGIERFRKPARR